MTDPPPGSRPPGSRPPGSRPPGVRLPGVRLHRFRITTGQVLAQTRRNLAGRDLALASAGATLYGALAAVPSLLVAVAVAGFVLGRHPLARYGRQLSDTVPTALGAGEWISALFGAGLSLSPVAVVFAVFMSSAYGRGLSRALRRFTPSDEPGSTDRLRSPDARSPDRLGVSVRPVLPPSWWSRALTLPLLGLAPLLLLALLVGTPAVSHLQRDDGLAGIAGASYLGLNLIWVITWLPLTWTFRVVAPGCPSWRAALTGGVVTGAFVSGFLQGFTLFLALPVNLGRPFGGLVMVGIVSALLLWLWVLHVVVCVGYAFTWALDAVWSARSDAADKPSELPRRASETT